MNPWDIIQKLESDNSRLFKESVVADHINDGLFVTGLQYALDPLVTFGVQQVPEKKDPTGEGLLPEDFYDMADDEICDLTPVADPPSLIGEESRITIDLRYYFTGCISPYWPESKRCSISGSCVTASD